MSPASYRAAPPRVGETTIGRAGKPLQTRYFAAGASCLMIAATRCCASAYADRSPERNAACACACEGGSCTYACACEGGSGACAREAR